MADTQPPRGFRGVFLWSPDPAEWASAPRIPASRVPHAIAAICRAPIESASGGSPLDLGAGVEGTTGGSKRSVLPTPTADASADRAPLAGIVVLGRWLGVKPGDEAWGVDSVEAAGDEFVVMMDRGRIRVEVGAPGPATLVPGPYGQLLIVAMARDVVVTVDGEVPPWLPSVHATRAHDMSGQARPWPLQRLPGARAWRARRMPVPALMLSVWWARPVPPELVLPDG